MFPVDHLRKLLALAVKNPLKHPSHRIMKRRPMKILCFSALFIAVLGFLALAGPVLADMPVVTVRPTITSACYTKDEAIAEQAIRIHSELMVIGLNCQHMTPAGQKNLYQSYREFTARHSMLFAQYEATLMGYFLRTGAANPEASLNTMRTAFANKISFDAAKMRPDLFCNHYMGRIQKVSTMNKADIQKWAGTFFPEHPVSHPLCK